MEQKNAPDNFFEQRITYPDFGARERFTRLIGLDDQKARLTKILSLLVNPLGLEKWAQIHHPNINSLMATVLRRPPLIVLAGDVGSGKTELAETVGDAVARQEDIDVTLLPLSLSTRGKGRVGEMTQLLSSVFDYAIGEASKLKGSTKKSRGGIILLVDEADALAQSRESEQMHHEDRAGVNAFIRGIDRITSAGLPAAVIMCTNRLGALDPAIKRRAADILTFARPTAEQRREVLISPLSELGFTATEIDKVVTATGERAEQHYGFTFSDLTQRLLPGIVLDAYPTRAVMPDRALQVIDNLVATPPFKEGRAK